MRAVRIVALLLGFGAAVVAAADTDYEVVGQLAHPRLTETSGIVASPSAAGLFWGVNDSGNRPELYVFSANGDHRGTVRVNGVHNYDWEDIAAFEHDGRPYLVIADTGDNEASRRVSFLVVVAEPVADDEGVFPPTVNVATRQPFRFEDGPKDCEAVAVDVEAQRIILIAKRLVPAPVYELPLAPPGATSAAVQTARRIGTLGGLPRPTPQEMLSAPLGPWRHQPTALDIAADGGLAVVATYQNLFVFRRARSQPWSEAFAQPVRVVRLPLAQFESVALAGDRAITVAEGRWAQLLRSVPLTD